MRKPWLWPRDMLWIREVSTRKTLGSSFSNICQTIGMIKKQYLNKVCILLLALKPSKKKKKQKKKNEMSSMIHYQKIALPFFLLLHLLSYEKYDSSNYYFK